jgi:hypothetical protein
MQSRGIRSLEALLVLADRSTKRFEPEDSLALI